MQLTLYNAFQQLPLRKHYAKLFDGTVLLSPRTTFESQRKNELLLYRGSPDIV
eukprot:SAG31_NODE_523_length_14545_cov_4.805067_14_plen_53_part_00